MADYDNRDRGALFKNDKRGNDKAPDYTGNYTTPDNQTRRIAAWITTSKAGQTYLALKMSDPQPRQQPAQETQQPQQQQPQQDYLDDIPF